MSKEQEVKPIITKDEVIFPITGGKPSMNKALKLAQHIMAKMATEATQMPEPITRAVYTDNGAHSYWTIIHPLTGEKLWSECPEECIAIGYPVKETQETTALKKENEELRATVEEMDFRHNELEHLLKGASIILGICSTSLQVTMPNTANAADVLKKEITECLTKAGIAV